TSEKHSGFQGSSLMGMVAVLIRVYCRFLSKVATLGFVLVSGAVFVPSADAGGYLAVKPTGGPYKWDGPVTLHFDLGPLGKLSNAQADAMVTEAVAEWTAAKIPGSTVQFIQGPDLSEDHGDGAGTDPNYDLNTPTTDGITAVIYDQTGLLTEQ